MSIRQRLIDRLHPVKLAHRLHEDQHGAISVLGVFTIFFLTLTLGMIFNIGKQVDEKLRMQNAADAATYSIVGMKMTGLGRIEKTDGEWHLILDQTACPIGRNILRDRIAIVFKPTVGGKAVSAWFGENPPLWPQHADQPTAFRNQNLGTW